MTKFRTERVQVGDRIVDLKMQPIEEIFQFKLPPFIILAGTGGGKTTLAMDIIHKYSSECTYIYYISATEESMKKGPTSTIPNVFKRPPTFESVSAVWQDIKAMSEAVNGDINTMKALLVGIVGREQANDIVMKLDAETKRIKVIREGEYLKTKTRADAGQLAMDDANAFACDTLAKLIVDRARTVGTSKLTADEMIQLQSLVSRPPKILLLLDDVSSQLQGMGTDKRKVVFNNMSMSVKDAYQQLIMDILTRGRHYNMLTCIFVHSLKVIKSIDLLANIVALDAQQAGRIQETRTFPAAVRELIPAMSALVFQHKYHFLYLSLDNSREPMVGLADLHTGEPLELSDMLQEFVKVCDSIESKQLPTGGGGSIWDQPQEDDLTNTTPGFDLTQKEDGGEDPFDGFY